MSFVRFYLSYSRHGKRTKRPSTRFANPAYCEETTLQRHPSAAVVASDVVKPDDTYAVIIKPAHHASAGLVQGSKECFRSERHNRQEMTTPGCNKMNDEHSDYYNVPMRGDSTSHHHDNANDNDGAVYMLAQQPAADEVQMVDNEIYG